ncbi:hypothetical protein BX600DRAFT_446499 [Xylariales sp. PMI_506]|nr:hypothetical protein BX600DRAFT_446499 [Xylariales sp. PMI_506]
MGGSQQPYLYDSDRSDRMSPVKVFDPKAVTRASWEPKPQKKKQNGPLIGFNLHPDLQEVPTTRTTQFRPMSSTTKGFIKWMWRIQLGLRCLELVANVGLLVLMILITNVDSLTAWVLRVATGVVALNCAYAIYHLAQRPGRRPPASSAAYQLFAAFTDVAILPFYAFGAMSAVNHSSEWSSLLSGGAVTAQNYLNPAFYYTTIGAGGLHVISLATSLWLGLMFRRISNMPPDMNPLEDHLTARHKRNKSSIATNYTAMSESSKRLSTPLEGHRRSGAPYEDLSRPPSIPFMHTRTGSRDSIISSKGDLPSRQYQIQPANSPRNSVSTVADARRLSKPASGRGSYIEIPLGETGTESPRPSSIVEPRNATPTRVAKFTEAWYASESLINRTQQRNRAMNAATKTRAYEALDQRYGADSGDENDEDDDDYSDRENGMRPDPMDVSDLEDNSILGGGGSPAHPNPLRMNPSPAPSTSSTPGNTPGKKPPRSKTPFYPLRSSALSEVSHNTRSVSGSQDIADEKAAGPLGRTLGPRNRDSSIQPEEGFFYSKPYGELKAATPPIMVGSGRQVSSGNDYDAGTGAGASASSGGIGSKFRRVASGKAAEEGRAGKRYSRFDVLDEN